MRMVDAAIHALQDIGEESHISVLRRHIEDHGYFEFGAKDPEGALSACMLRHSANVDTSRDYEEFFYRSRPATFGLLENARANQTLMNDIEMERKASEDIQDYELDTSLFLEEELHRWLHKNLQDNGLQVLGFGELREFDPMRQQKVSGKYNTNAVGQIDLLLVNSAGDFIIIELKRRSSDQTVGQLCRYWGWVKTELATEGQRVFGVVVAQDVSDQLRFAIKATHQDICYRSLEMQVRLGEPSR